MDVMSCPVCGYVVTEIEYTSIQCDPECPRCRQETISTFLPNRIGKIT
jgi:predicted Zn-ribbon and HTH transcriptional regulator